MLLLLLPLSGGRIPDWLPDDARASARVVPDGAWPDDLRARCVTALHTLLDAVPAASA